MQEYRLQERTPIEGTLFIYSRDPATTPTHAHAFLILSKLTNENLVVYLEREMMIHTQPPFVLFKRTKAGERCLNNANNLKVCYGLIVQLKVPVYV